jgi:hypothetical protein
MRLGALICHAVVKDHDTDVGFLCPKLPARLLGPCSFPFLDLVR